ncbi:MAG: hypothetical protein RL660_2800 [Bacteroidota bacterium]|jgi:hypothetical protein
MYKGLVIFILISTRLFGQEKCTEYLVNGISAVEKKEYTQAIENFTNGTNCSNKPPDCEIYYYLGISYLNISDTNLAMLYFQNSLKNYRSPEDVYYVRQSYDELIGIFDAKHEYDTSLKLYLEMIQIPTGFLCSRGPYGVRYKSAQELSSRFSNAGYLDSAFIVIAPYIFGNSYQDYFYQDTDTNEYRKEVNRVFNNLIKHYDKKYIAKEINEIKLKEESDLFDYTYKRYYITIFNARFEYDLVYLKPNEYSKNRIRKEFKKSDLYRKLKNYCNNN